MPNDLTTLPDRITVAKAVAWLAPQEGDRLTLEGTANVDGEYIVQSVERAMGLRTELSDPPEVAPSGSCPLYDLVLVKREQPTEVKPRTLTKSEHRPQLVAKNDAKRVIWYPLYLGPEEDDAHRQRMSEDDLLEMTWASYGNDIVNIEHGFDQGLKKVFGKDELTPLEGRVVEHYTLERDMAEGEEWRGSILQYAMKKNTPIEAIRYSAEVYAILSQITHGISLEGDGYSEER